MDKVLKQRLVGASILIALAVIFLPMLFDNGGDDADEQRELALDLPERQSGDRQVRRLPLDTDRARTPPNESQAEPPRETRPAPAQRDARQAEQEDRPEPVRPEPETPAAGEVPEDATEATSPETAESESAPEQEEESSSASDSNSDSDSDSEPVRVDADADAGGEPEPAPAASVDGSWVVQVAVFSSRETANSIRQRLNDLGHRVSMDVLIRDQAELFRLRTGPYADEGAAEQARGQIAATVAGVDPATRELSGGGDAEERSGMAVQVGSFASHNNAERLVGQLTESGFDAFMYGEETGGRTIWRVRVGSYEERADAERLLETLREERGLDGIVVSHP